MVYYLKNETDTENYTSVSVFLVRNILIEIF